MRLALDSSSMPKALQIGMLYGIASVGIVLVLLFLVIVFLYQGRRRQRNAPDRGDSTRIDWSDCCSD